MKKRKKTSIKTYSKQQRNQNTNNLYNQVLFKTSFKRSLSYF